MDHLSLGSLGLGSDLLPPRHPWATTPHLVYQSTTTAIYRLRDTGIKVSLDPNSSSEELVRKLLREQEISRVLPSSCHKRQTIDVTSFNQWPALTFQWANGITVKEWLENCPHMDLSVRLRAATAIAKTLSEFHDGGVAYNCLSPDNIVLELSGGDVVATFIDLSSAFFFRSDTEISHNSRGSRVASSSSINRQMMKGQDLRDLGLVLNLLLQGEDKNCDDEGRNSRYCSTVVSNRYDENAKTHVASTMYCTENGTARALTSTNYVPAGKSGSLDDFLPQDWIASIDADDGNATIAAPIGCRISDKMVPGGNPCTHNIGYGDETHRIKQKKQNAVGDGLPLYLGALISTLLAGNNGDCSVSSTSPDLCYESATDVYFDLKVMMENPSSGLRKCIPDEATIKGRLRLQGDLFYGRQVQMSMLMHLVQSGVEMDSQPLMAMISGYPGTGKSTLVKNVRDTLTDRTHFIEGKFVKSGRPDAVLAYALDSFFSKIIDDDANYNVYTSMKWRVQDAIGSVNGSVLLQIMPNLRKWLAQGNASAKGLESTPKGIGSSHRLKFMFCKLIGAIAFKGYPLILYLDDLQWADSTTLDIIRMVMTDPDTHHFIFLGSYRDNEVGPSHPLAAKLKAIQEQDIRIVAIKVGPIEKDFVTTMLSDALCLPPSLCRPLSSIVHSKTGGIMLFILRFLASLNDEGLLWYSMTSRQWRWDLTKIRQKEIHGDVVSHMTQHMTRLSKKMQMGLKVAACLGPHFDTKTFERAKKDGDIGFLESCVENGFLQILSSDDKFIWSHDQIQQAAYNLIPRDKREPFHLLLGSRLFMKTSSSEMEDMIFVLVDNMNRGSKLIEDQSQKYEVAELNLRAGEKALAMSAFDSASKYLMAGLRYLDENAWVEKYSLTINLYDAASVALLLNGDFTELSTISEKPLVNAQSFEDKLNIYNSVVRALAAATKYEEGITTCVFVLSQLGVKIPTDITADVYQDEATQVTQLLAGKSEKELLSLPKLIGRKNVAAMQFLNHAIMMTYIAKPRMNPIIVFRMIKMSVEHGICNVSSFAFGCFGAWLVSQPSFDVDRAYSMGRLATEMMKKLGASEMIPRVYTPVYCMINIWKEPWQACLSKNLESYESGAKSGDLEYAISGLYQYCTTAIYGCGENLEGISQKICSHIKWVLPFKQIRKSLIILNQLTVDLMGIEQNAFLPYDNVMTEATCCTSARENNEISVCRLICHKRKYLAFLTGNLDTAAEMYDLCMEYNDLMGPTGRSVNLLVTMFIDGLVGFFFARKHNEDEEKWFKIGQAAMHSMREWASNCSEWNFTNKLHLLEAEYYFFKEDDERAMKFYNASIKAARDHRFVHEEGLAEEKLATYLLHKRKHHEAISAFANAKKCYERWGAHILVRRMEKSIDVIDRCLSF